MPLLFFTIVSPSREKSDINELILASQSGDHLARETMIKRYTPFIYKVVSRICGQFIGSSDDEASVGLIAFNEAIDNYNPDKGASFFSFAEIVIKRRLIDFFRQEKNVSIPLSSLVDEFEEELQTIEFQQSNQIYQKEEEARDRQEEILRYQLMLNKYGISFQDLVKVSPKHKDARIRAMDVAHIIANDDSLKEHLLIKKELPLKALLAKVDLSRKTLERQRKYIIALALILIFEFPMLKEYVKLREEKGGEM